MNWIRISDRDMRDAPEVRNWIFAYCVSMLIGWCIGGGWMEWHRDPFSGLAMRYCWSPWWQGS